MNIADDVLGLVLAFEVYAAISKRLPLITHLCRRHRWLILLIVAATVGHLARRVDGVAPPAPH